MGTTMTRVGRLGQNKGYEMRAELPAVRQAAVDVLSARGYEVSIKPDPGNGPDGAGEVVIAERAVAYSAAAGAPVSRVPAKMDTRDLINVFVSKKWRVSDNKPVLGVTLVEIVGGSYLRQGADSEEVETPMTDESVALLRDEIERRVSAVGDGKGAAGK